MTRPSDRGVWPTTVPAALRFIRRVKQELFKVGYETRLRVQSIVKYLPCRLGCASRPSFLVIGAQKAGTTSLFNYLTSHPRIVSSRPKEVGFFHLDHRFQRGRTFYATHFPLRQVLGRHRITFEASPAYMYYPQTAERIHSLYPDIKLVAILRQPASRAYSHWNMFRELFEYKPPELESLPNARLWSTAMRNAGGIRPFREMVEEEIDDLPDVRQQPEPSLVRRGIYYDQLARFFEWFERSQILIMESSRFSTHTRSEINRVCRFLEIDEIALSNTSDRYHQRPYSEPMDPQTKERLREFYGPHNRHLYELIGESFDWD